MTINKLVKWGKESQEFFEKAEDNSVVLDLVISFGCASQTGEGFEELVNTINSENIKRKVKKVVITDTSYLYRHDNPEFSKYSDPNVPTEWYLKNKEAIEKLEVEKEVKSWAVGLNTKEFKKWHDKIRRDFEGDENGVGIVLEFRDKVMQASSVAAYKNNTDVRGCIEFMLEETAYTCAFLDGSALVYPSNLAAPIENTIERYNVNVKHVDYKTSKQSQRNSHNSNINMESVDKEIISFMKKDAKNVNFFVIDKHGSHIYKNYALNRIVGNTNAKRLNPKTWEISCEVMRTGKQIITEEQSLEGNDYLTIKSPLVINSKVEGVIGLAVDITDKKKREYAEKKKEELENKLKMKEELYNVARYVAHDLAQPVNVLKGYLDLNKSLKEEEKKIFGEVARSIENITDRLLIKYGGVKDIKEKSYIFVKWCLDKVVKQIREQKKEIEIKRVFNR
ncbi:MAG: hypothetical protein LBI93_03025, partial [Endomicrobium sp.]|nr:hypothetical protein [Endomicrobium sp.]